MTHFDINPELQNPLYPGSMPLGEVCAGVQFITLDTRRGNLKVTSLASRWRAEVIPIVYSSGLTHTAPSPEFLAEATLLISKHYGSPLSSVVRLLADDVDGDTVDLCEEGVHPPVEADETWNPNRVSVLADRSSVLTFYPWMIKEGFTRAANETEEIFFEYFVDSDVFWKHLMQS